MCESGAPLRRLGVWISDKKSQKLKWCEFRTACLAAGFELVKLDAERPLEEQGPLCVLLHKMTDIIVRAELGEPKAAEILKGVEQYLSNHPEVTVIDPLDNVRILLNRHRYYAILEREPSFKNRGILTPAFAEVTAGAGAGEVAAAAAAVRARRVAYPLVCKPSVSHGKSAHEMALVFNERGLRVCRAPCVLQSFVNHNALLYKVYVIGNRYHISERPSLKNFYASEELEPIHYGTGDVCKADSQSTLSILDPQDVPHSHFKMTLDEAKVTQIIRVLGREIGLLLYGFDVVIDNATGDHAVIDINVYPSYDSFPRYFEHLLAGVESVVAGRVSGEPRRMCNGFVNVGTSSVKMNMLSANGQN